MQQKKHFRLLKENCEDFLKEHVYEWTNERTIFKKMCNENVPWMLKVLQGTIDASKSAALCLFCLKPIGIRIKSNTIIKHLMILYSNNIVQACVQYVLICDLDLCPKPILSQAKVKLNTKWKGFIVTLAIIKHC